MGFFIEGLVEVVRISELADATEITGANFITDKAADPVSKKVTDTILNTKLDHNILKNLNIADFQHLTAEEKSRFFSSLRDSGVAVIALGTPNELTLDCENANQKSFEPRESVGTLTIDIDFDLLLTNVTGTYLISFILQLTGTRIITFESDVLVSIPSTIGSWDDVQKELTLTAGTDDIIEFQMLRYGQSSKWLLKVSEVAL